MTEEQPAATALDRAIAIAGNQEKLGEAIGSSQSEVSQWVTGRRPVPPKKAVAIERATGISRREFRPDDWHELWPELAA